MVLSWRKLIEFQTQLQESPSIAPVEIFVEKNGADIEDLNRGLKRLAEVISNTVADNKSVWNNNQFQKDGHQVTTNKGQRFTTGSIKNNKDRKDISEEPGQLYRKISGNVCGTFTDFLMLRRLTIISAGNVGIGVFTGASNTYGGSFGLTILYSLVESNRKLMHINAKELLLIIDLFGQKYNTGIYQEVWGTKYMNLLEMSRKFGITVWSQTRNHRRCTSRQLLTWRCTKQTDHSNRMVNRSQDICYDRPTIWPTQHRSICVSEEQENRSTL
ncbi:hypothetical protein BB559_005162 [Furculomyces boomerangus]|uniref:Uncharacterized protein n=2 Tax=Harpellales TaxID=61421 RepID=A0A2T9YAC2_9FUNG|nr:hypothetical protein BB559_005162 [Furculomyces boomerangus]PWA00009.1 hypothetical protein BB558_003956 [Smittium angustum]